MQTALLLDSLGFAVTGLVPDDGGRRTLEAAAAERRLDVEVVTADLSYPEQRSGLVGTMAWPRWTWPARPCPP